MSDEYDEAGSKGWAVKKDGTLTIRTASNRKVGAMINALVLYCGVSAWATANWTDSQIEQLFNEHGPPKGLELVEVELMAQS